MAPKARKGVSQSRKGKERREPTPIRETSPLPGDPSSSRAQEQGNQDLPAGFENLAATIGEAVTSEVMARMTALLTERLAHLVPPQVPPAGTNQAAAGQNVRSAERAAGSELSMEAKHLRDFKKYNPRTFEGSLSDPTKAERWLTSIETIFRYMKCPEDQKLQCAVFMLIDDAQMWWESVERMISQNGEVISWDQFKEHFHEQYFSVATRFEKHEEFLSLKQGSRSVLEYEREFTKLSRFAPRLVATDEDRTERFVHGLREDIRGHVTAHEPLDYTKAFRIARRLDDISGKPSEKPSASVTT